MNIFRLNFSHGEHADHALRYQWIREVEQQLNYPLGILMDLQGPKLRVGRFADGKVQLQRGQALRLDLDKTPGDSRRVNLPHPEIIAALEPGMDLLLDDGKLRLRVTAKHSDAIDTEVLNGGELSDRKGSTCRKPCSTSPRLPRKTAATWPSAWNWAWTGWPCRSCSARKTSSKHAS